MKDYDAYLFDWDGTIADTLQIWTDVIQSNLEKLGIEVPLEAIILALGDWNDLLQYGMSPSDLEKFGVASRAQAEELAPLADIYPLARETLMKLKKSGKKLALITASHREIIDKALAHNKLETMFDVVISYSDITHPKPDPEGLLKAMDRLQLSDKAKIVMIGDSNRDLEAANKAGVDKMLFHPPSHSLIYDIKHLQSFNPDYIFTDWQELFEMAGA